jgi:F420-non-reducing hydrogenase iron-sulfur subunit
MAILKQILRGFGYDEDRVWLRWISASEGKLFADTVISMVDELKKKGPNPINKLWTA